MKKQVKLTESDLKNVVKGAVMNILKEYTDFDKMKTFGMSSFDEEADEDNFNEQPINNLAANEGRQYKVNEAQLYQIIKESVYRILKESGEKHRFGVGKYGLAMDAASKAKSLGRIAQASNLMQHASDAFNKEYGTDSFEMDGYGDLRHMGDDNNKRLYRPNSRMNRLKTNKSVYDKADEDNYYIRNAARTAKAYPRMKMTKGLSAVDTVDNFLHGNK